MTRRQLSFVGPVQLAISVGDTTPNPGSSGVRVWSTTLGASVEWNGSAWSQPSGSGGSSTPAFRSIQASEALAAGAFVNVWNSSGAGRVRNASNAADNLYADGFVLAAVASGAMAAVYFPGSSNTAVTGLTPGAVYLGTGGGVTSTPPSTNGQVMQAIGVADSATSIQFMRGLPLLLS